jgi:putative SOS response-associated peptidase YedK
MPPPPRAGGFPVTNIRNTTSPHWRGWLKPESRCLVPVNSFAEYGEINAAALSEVEDREIEKIIKKQEDVGLKVAADERCG